jgi:hypothetical protein
MSLVNEMAPASYLAHVVFGLDAANLEDVSLCLERYSGRPG